MAQQSRKCSQSYLVDNSFSVQYIHGTLLPPTFLLSSITLPVFGETGNSKMPPRCLPYISSENRQKVGTFLPPSYKIPNRISTTTILHRLVCSAFFMPFIRRWNETFLKNELFRSHSDQVAVALCVSHPLLPPPRCTPCLSARNVVLIRRRMKFGNW